MSEKDDAIKNAETIGEELSDEALDKVRGGALRANSGDEVLVAFEHGDTRHPVVIGGLFNGKD